MNLSLAAKSPTDSFAKVIKSHSIDLHRTPLEVLQLNIGKRCNQACHHCHVESSPIRTENMELKTVDRLLELLKNAPDIHTVDITGGAPEMNPHFKYFVKGVSALGKKVIDRCNLTILFEEGQEDTAQFLADHKVEIVASLPCYLKDNVDKQRGRGVFNKSIEALKILNNLGYGKSGTGMTLNLVYNPVGVHLPPSQSQLEADYKIKLKEDLDIEFNQLFTITNMPIKRYLTYLEKAGQLETYMQLLLDNFNPAATKGLMCLNQISVGYDGAIYDCDFNQMLEIPLNWKTKNIWEISSLEEFNQGSIAIDDHCFGCTAGSGSSCGGSLTN